MPELDDLVLEAIGAHLPAHKLESSMGANGLRIPSLHLAVRVHDSKEIRRTEDSMGISAIVQAGSINSIGGGIDVLHTGMGDSPESAAANAAHQWIAGVLPVIVSYLTHRDHPDVEHSQMIVAVEDTGEKFGWHVLLGPIVTRLYSDADLPAELPKSEIFQTIFNAVHPLAAHSQLFWLECFAVRYPDGRIDATCRFRNNDWEDGQTALLQWAAGWPPMTAFISRRQFIIFEPTPIDKLPSGKDLSERLRLHKEARKPWWRRLWS